MWRFTNGESWWKGDRWINVAYLLVTYFTLVSLYFVLFMVRIDRSYQLNVITLHCYLLYYIYQVLPFGDWFDKHMLTMIGMFISYVFPVQKISYGKCVFRKFRIHFNIHQWCTGSEFLWNMLCSIRVEIVWGSFLIFFRHSRTDPEYLKKREGFSIKCSYILSI